MRRLKGRVLATTRGHTLASSPVHGVRDLEELLRTQQGRFSPADAATLALLAIVDRSAADAVRLAATALAALARRHSTEDERQLLATQRVSAIMSVLAPLGGAGRYGALTPPCGASPTLRCSESARRRPSACERSGGDRW
jgi:hypothetical protein